MPAVWYNSQLNKHPLLVKSITSGFMYGAGDACAQLAESYTLNKDKPKSEKQPLRLNWRRIGVFFVFGTLISGPAYHYWFGYLDLVSAASYSACSGSLCHGVVPSFCFFSTLACFAVSYCFCAIEQP